jgi:hypothetical protein
MLDAGLLAGIRDQFALFNFDVLICGIPEIGYKEDCVGAVDGVEKLRGR